MKDWAPAGFLGLAGFLAGFTLAVSHRESIDTNGFLAAALLAAALALYGRALKTTEAAAAAAVVALATAALAMRSLHGAGSEAGDLPTTVLILALVICATAGLILCFHPYEDSTLDDFRTADKEGVR